MAEVNIKSTTIEKGLDLAKDFLQSVVKPSLDEIGQLFADNVKVWRVNNQIRNLRKVEKIIKEKGITTKLINLKVLFPYLDGVSFEEDETLQDMWANLFVNYIDAKKNLSIIVYPDILKQLSTNEVKILTYVSKNSWSHGTWLSHYSEEIPAQKDEIANLVRLGLIEERIEIEDNSYQRVNIGSTKIEYKHKKTSKFILTQFGKEFLVACNRDEDNNDEALD